MSFFDYANKTQSNIIPKKEFEELTHEVFSVIAENMAKSLGPLGSSATIIEGMMTSATKDGYTIMKSYRFRNTYKKMIYNLFLAPCTKMNNTVGDATTTAIVLTNSMYNRYQEQQGQLNTLYRLPRQFINIWDELIKDLTDRVKNMATPLDPDSDDIYNIAYVTSNGNKEVSEAVAKVYKEAKTPGIKKKDSPTNKSYIVPVDGFEFPANLISDVFVRNEDLSANESHLAILIFDHKLETDIFDAVVKPINDVMRARGHKLLVIAPFFDAHLCEFSANQYLIQEKTRYGYMNLIMAQYVMGDLEPHQLEDLSTVLRVKTINQNLEKEIINAFNANDPDDLVESILEEKDHALYRVIGSCHKAFLTCRTGSIFKVRDIEDDENYQQALRAAEAELETITNSVSKERQAYASKIYNARARVLQLKMKNYIYYIGADSALQKQILEDSIDDVIKCLRSAVKCGVVPGCQLSIMKACTDYLSELESKLPNEPDDADKNDLLRLHIVSLIYSACYDVYTKILHGPEGVGMVKLLPRWEFTTEEGTESLKKEAVKKAQDIIKESLERNEVFDMESLEFSDKIITSAETDTMVLSAASELVKILISGNQCVMLDGDIDESHEEVHSVYV